MSNAGVRMTDLFGMYLRRVEMTTVVFAKIQLVKSGIHDMTVNDLESHYLAGGRVGNVTRADQDRFRKIMRTQGKNR